MTSSFERTPRVWPPCSRRSQVLLENLGPSRATKLGLDADEARAAHPHLLAVSSKGYGHQGPWSRYRAYAYNLHARAPWCTSRGPGRAIRSTRSRWADVIAGYAIATLVAAWALGSARPGRHDRLLDGRAGRQSVQRVLAAADLNGADLFEDGTNHRRPVARTPVPGWRWALRRLVGGHDEHWARLCTLLDPRWLRRSLADRDGRQRSADSLDEAVRTFTTKHAGRTSGVAPDAGVPSLRGAPRDLPTSTSSSIAASTSRWITRIGARGGSSGCRGGSSGATADPLAPPPLLRDAGDGRAVADGGARSVVDGPVARGGTSGAPYSDEDEQLLAESIAAQVEEPIPTTVSGLERFDDGEFWGQLATTDLLGPRSPRGARGGWAPLLDATIVADRARPGVAPVPYLGCRRAARSGCWPPRAPIRRLDRGARRRELRWAVAFDSGLADVAHRPRRRVACDCAGASTLRWRSNPTATGRASRSDDQRESLDLTRQVRTCVRPRVIDPASRRAALRRCARDVGGAALVASPPTSSGVMAGALDLAVEHADGRIQFGVPIGRFQAVQHLLADAHVDVEGARSLVNHAAWAIDHIDLADAVTAAHVAKAYCSEKGKLVCEATIQVHGGMGMTWECRAHLFHRRAMADRALLGDEAVHYRASTWRRR